MITRIQEINGDRVLEIVRDEVSTVRLSENKLLAQKQYLEESIAVFQSQLDEVNANLSLITTKHEETLQARASL